MRSFTRRALLTGAAATVLPAAGALLLSAGHKSTPPAAITAPPSRARSAARVNIFNRAKLPLGIDPSRFVATMQRYVDEFLRPVWGVSARLAWSDGPGPGTMNMAFTDVMEVAGAVAYHDFDPDVWGMPYGEIGVIEAYMSGFGLSQAFSHELAEMLIDPATNLWAARSSDEITPKMKDASLWAYEIADRVQDTWFTLDGIRVSNFVYPAYFELWRDGPMDFLGELKAPGDLSDGGYQQVRLHDDTTNVVSSDGAVVVPCYRVKVRAASTSRLRKS